MTESETTLAAQVRALEGRVRELEQARLAPYMLMCGVIDHVWLLALKGRKAFNGIKNFLGLNKQ